MTKYRLVKANRAYRGTTISKPKTYISVSILIIIMILIIAPVGAAVCGYTNDSAVNAACYDCFTTTECTDAALCVPSTGAETCRKNILLISCGVNGKHILKRKAALEARVSATDLSSTNTTLFTDTSLYPNESFASVSDQLYYSKQYASTVWWSVKILLYIMTMFVISIGIAGIGTTTSLVRQFVKVVFQFIKSLDLADVVSGDSECQHKHIDFALGRGVQQGSKYQEKTTTTTRLHDFRCILLVVFFSRLVLAYGTDCSANSTSASIYGTYAYCVSGQYLCDPYATIAKRGCDVSSP